MGEGEKLKTSLKRTVLSREEIFSCNHDGHVVNNKKHNAGLPGPADSTHTPGLLFCSCSGLDLPATVLVSAQDK